MSFDTEPERRYLLYHSGTGCLFETHCISRAMEYLDSGEVEDVTNVPDYERKYKNRLEDLENLYRE